MLVLRTAVVLVTVAASPALGQPLSLEEALRAGEAQSPRLAAQRHMLDSASHQVGRAGELPDPKLRFGIESLPITGPDRFRYDREPMTTRQIGWAQEFPNAAKREARNLRAERARGVEGANLQAQRTLLRREIATSWLEVHYTERARVALQALGRRIGLQLDAVAAGIARGRQTAAEGFAIRQALEQVNDGLIEQDRAIARARIALAAWLGNEAQRPLAEPPDVALAVIRADDILARVAELPQVRVLGEREGLARAEVDLARSEKRSDWMLEVGYGQRRPAFDNMLTVMVSIELPWQTERRQDRDIASRLAELEQARAIREEARRMQEAEVRGWLADFDAAARRIERSERVLLPLARDRAAAALAAYRGGRGDLGLVLEAERAVTETELALVQVLAERAKAWANLNFLFAREDGQ
jgi:outer membrane protein TolC